MEIKMDRELIGIIGQWTAVFVVTLGIGIEVGYGAHIGFVLITAGGVILALATKIKYLRGK